MTLAEWARTAIPETLPPLRRTAPVRLFPHQEIGARRILALLRRFRGALLLDGVGMGKSFTAAAVAREWRGFGRVAAAVPAPLVATWRSTLARFGVEADLVTHDGLRLLPAPAPETLLVVDEAHRFRNPSTRRYDALAACAREGALLLVTATPLCNRLDDIRALARLAFEDDALKAYGVPSLDAAFDAARPEEIRTILALTGVRRVQAAGVPFPRAERQVVRYALGRAGDQVARDLETLEVPLCGAEASPALVKIHLRARLESSPEALRDSLWRQRRFYRRAREKLGEGFVLARRDFATLFEREEREMFQELLFPEAFLSRVGPDADLQRAIERELRRIDAILSALDGCENDKVARLGETLRVDGVRPAIVFTRAIATAALVADAFRAEMRTGVASSRGAADERGARVTLDDLVRSFRTLSLDLLVLTDLAAEGLDLQAAATVIHYDAPWTAVKLDQRNGRAARIGQQRSIVRSIYFVPARLGEDVALRFVARKERLANRYLEAAPFDPAVGICGEAVRVVTAGDRSVVVEDGAVVAIGNLLTADPRVMRGLASREIEAGAPNLAWWNGWKDAARVIPSRIPRGCPQARLASMLRSTRSGMHPALRDRFRIGIERRLEALDSSGPSGMGELDRLVPIRLHDAAPAGAFDASPGVTGLAEMSLPSRRETEPPAPPAGSPP